MKFDCELVGKIGSMALINREINELDYNTFSRIGKYLQPGYVWVSSGAVEIGKIDYYKRHDEYLEPEDDVAKSLYASQGQCILMENYRRFIKPEYSVRQILLEHSHFNDSEKSEYIKTLLLESMIKAVEGKNVEELLEHMNGLFQLCDGASRKGANGMLAKSARLMSGYILDYYGYGFSGIGSLEEYFAYDPDEYYASLQMGLPVLYYSGRENPPHPEIWINYFLRMMELYSRKVYELSKASEKDELVGSLSYLNTKEKHLLAFLLKKRLYEFTPIEVSKMLGVTNKTVINRCVKLANNGFLIPNIVKTRIRSYSLSEFARANEKQIIKKLS